MNYRTFGLALDPDEDRDRLFDLPMIPITWFIAVLAFSVILLVGMMILNGLTIQVDNYAFATIISSVLVLAAVRYGTRQSETLAKRRLKDFSEHSLLFTAVCLLGVIASYPVAAVSSGFADPALARADALLHFDWVNWYAFVASHPVLQHLGTAAYSTIYVSPAILLGYMAWTGRRAAARQFLLAFWLAAFLTLLLFPLFPAAGPLEFLWRGAIPYMPTTALYQGEIIPALRAHTFTQIDLGSLRGLVCAPSFHTVCAVLYIVWAWPIARLRWILTPVNIAMLLATPVEGTHYLIDMVIGLTVAVVTTLVVRSGTRILARGPLARTVLATSPQVT